MYIKKFNIKNFKSFNDVTFYFNSEINILTGKNNSGKTTVLEALALWHECFGKLIHKAKRSDPKIDYKAGDWIFGPIGTNRYFPFDEINSVRSPYFEDIFHERERKNKIILTVVISDNENKETIEIPFIISESGLNYDISLYDYKKFDFNKFNNFFKLLPEPIGKYYATPVANILPKENFVTDPQVKDAILKRNSASILRNRLYRLLKFPNSIYISNFIKDLSYILGQNIELISNSDIQKDKQVIINFKFKENDKGEKDAGKDIALVGSGTLQIIEILLNLYQPEETLNNINLYNIGEPIKDLNIVLLDEPDSYTHREIQKRLTELLNRFSKNNQIFISTHNEALIRNASYNQLFHLEGKKEAVIKSIDKDNVAKIQPHFKGIYPSQINPIIRSLGNASGLDFVNAIESNKLIFVEGEDDARILSILLNQQTPPSNKKYMFWVLGGISTALENINAYKTVFSSIKNNKTLWEKSIFIFDKDDLSIEHKELFCQKLKENLNLESYSWNSYTLESVLLTDIEKFTTLLFKWIIEKNVVQIDFEDLKQSVNKEYQNFNTILKNQYTEDYYEKAYFRYKSLIDLKSEKLFGKKLLQFTEPQLMNYIRKNNESILDAGEYYKLMNKNDVESLILNVLRPYALSFSIKDNFIEFFRFVDKKIWFTEWDFLMKI